MRYSVSETAEYGDYTRGPRVLDEKVDENMLKILEEIRSGEFAREWIAESEAGLSNMNQYRQDEANLPIEGVGKQLRKMMGWLSSEKKDNVAPTATS